MMLQVEIEKALLPRFIFPCIAAVEPWFAALACSCTACQSVTKTPACCKSDAVINVGAVPPLGAGHTHWLSTDDDMLISAEYAHELALSRTLRFSRQTRHAVVPDDPMVQHAIHFTQGKLSLVIPETPGGIGGLTPATTTPRFNQPVSPKPTPVSSTPTPGSSRHAAAATATSAIVIDLDSTSSAATTRPAPTTTTTPSSASSVSPAGTAPVLDTGAPPQASP